MSGKAKGAPRAEKTKTGQSATEARRAANEAAAQEKNERRYTRISVMIGAALSLLTILSNIDTLKAAGAIALLGGVAVCVWKRRTIGVRFGLVGIAAAAYCLMIAASCLYAPAGKFALLESLKNIMGLAVFLAALGLEPVRARVNGRQSAIALEVGAGILSLLSIDLMSARTVSTPVVRLFARVSPTIAALEGADFGRMESIIGNQNVFAGITGLAILLSLGLLRADRKDKQRALHLSCLCVNAVAFLLGLSRGAMLMLALAFLVFFFLEHGASRGQALMQMIEVFVFAAAAALAGFVTQDGSLAGTRFVPLAATMIATVGLVVFDRFVGNRLSEALGRRTRGATVVLCVVLCIGALFGAAAVMLTGPAYVQGDDWLIRAVNLAPGDYTVRTESDGECDISVHYVPKLDGFRGKREWLVNTVREGEIRAYYVPIDRDSGERERHEFKESDGLPFTVPEDAGVVFFQFRSDDGATITRAYYDGVSSGEIKLRYLLLPENIADFLQGTFHSESFLLRRMQWQAGLDMWRQSPVIGHGVGAYENQASGQMRFFYATKYAHSHYVQTLCEMGVVGLALFVLLLGISAAAVVLARRRDGSNPLLGALGACVVFMAGQAATDLIFSSSYYLLFAFGVFALIELCSGDALLCPRAARVQRWCACGAACLVLVWTGLLACNLCAKLMVDKETTFEALASAAKLDPFEGDDYRLAYARFVNTYDHTDEQEQQMRVFLAEMERSKASTMPLYVAEAYFALGESERAFEMLQRYTDIRTSDASVWYSAFLMTVSYYSDNDVCIRGVTALYRKMQAWNETALVPITLDEQMQHYIDSVVALS